MAKHVPIRTLAKDEHRFHIEDCAMPGEIVFAEEEKPYRRGYSQGLSITRQFLEEAIKAGMSIDDIVDELRKCESKLMRWRWSGNDWIRGQPVKATYPPDPRIHD